MNDQWRLQTGILLLLLSSFGVVYGARAGLAQIFYFQAKYGAHADYPRRVIRRCEIAHRYYPFNYLFCIWTSNKAWDSRFDLEGKEIADRLEVAEYWCDAGLKLNYHKSQLRLLKSYILRKQSPRRAARYWGYYVDWQFWEPYNHAVLADLYAQAGDFAKAVETLQWVKGSEHYDHAKGKLDKAWAKEMSFEMPPAIAAPKQ